MGQKVHPTSFRIPTIYEWRSQWYAEKNYAELLREDRRIREFIMKRLNDAAVSRIDIERNVTQLGVKVWTAKPGIVIGRQGQNVEALRGELQRMTGMTGQRMKLDVEEIRVPELDAQLVARNVAEQLERRIPPRRAIKQAVQRTMQRGAQGAKIVISGRLGGAEIARRTQEMTGRVPLHTLRADIDYGFAEAHTMFGRIGVKTWIYKGERLPFEPDEGRVAAGGPATAVAPPATSPVSGGGA